MVLVENVKIIYLFLEKIGKEKVFGNFPHSKKTFLDDKNIEFRESKTCIFQRGWSLVIVQNFKIC